MITQLKDIANKIYKIYKTPQFSVGGGIDFALFNKLPAAVLQFAEDTE